MDCDDVRRHLLTPERLPSTAREGIVDEHLSHCQDCRRFSAEIDHIWQMLDHLPGLEPSDDFNRSVWSKIEKRRSHAHHGLLTAFLRRHPILSFSSLSACLIILWLVWRPVSKPAAPAYLAALSSAPFFHVPPAPAPLPPAPASATGFSTGPARDAAGDLMLREVDTILSLDPGYIEETTFLDVYQEWDSASDKDKNQPLNHSKKPMPATLKSSGASSRFGCHLVA